MFNAYATTMIYAQGFKANAEQLAEIKAKADRFREITGTSEPTNINITVKHPASQEIIGYLTYTA